MLNLSWNTLWKQNPNRIRWLVTLVAIGALLVIVALAAVNATATPRSGNEVQIQGWVNELTSNGLTARRQEAQHNLEKAGAEAVPALLVALRSSNPTQRRNAADMLGYIASPLATEGLINALKNDPVPAVRRNAAWALGEIQDARVIQELSQAAVADRSQIVRTAAADSLARIRTVLALAARVNEQHVGAFANAPADPNLLYLAAKRELLVSRDGGKQWDSLGSVLPSQVSALAVNPGNSQELYAGIEAMGIFKSQDGGATWTAINNGITLTPGAREVISAIAIDPENPQSVYVAHGVWLGTGTVEFYPLGLMQSRDGGEHWQALTAGSSAESIAKLAFRDGQLYGLAGDRLLTLVTPR